MSGEASADLKNCLLHNRSEAPGQTLSCGGLFIIFCVFPRCLRLRRQDDRGSRLDLYVERDRGRDRQRIPAGGLTALAPRREPVETALGEDDLYARFTLGAGPAAGSEPLAVRAGEHQMRLKVPTLLTFKAMHRYNGVLASYSLERIGVLFSSVGKRRNIHFTGFKNRRSNINDSDSPIPLDLAPIAPGADGGVPHLLPTYGMPPIDEGSNHGVTRGVEVP